MTRTLPEQAKVQTGFRYPLPIHLQKLLREWLEKKRAGVTSSDPTKGTQEMTSLILPLKQPRKLGQSIAVEQHHVTIMPFGKYKGMPLRELPTEYLRWPWCETTLREPLLVGVCIELFQRKDLDYANH